MKFKDYKKDARWCPCCSSDSRVIDSRDVSDGLAIRRRRECLNDECLHRWTTYERNEEEVT